MFLNFIQFVDFFVLQNYELFGQVDINANACDLMNFFDSVLIGNPLVCNCLLRPVAYWLISLGRVQNRGQSWDQATCHLPNFLAGRSVGSVLEEQLICEDSETASNFKLNPDVKVRDIKE